ncbi:GNAT family N-acetyltransferase [Gynurincola endophyticus]|uniref:GNAT family N-acetyltransferase n=1 Tax=Gynurincola endophyticus TaxID=2479004 RepID=UPI000F8F0CE6|nr:GNAT family N-acetyltransferase [Gynurincola endophyticus]
MKEIIVKEANPKDITILQQIGRDTFFETFSSTNSAEDMKKYLAESFSTEKLLSELNHPDSLFFIAWHDQVSVGYLKLNTGQAQTELQDDTAIEIERIYVKKEYHGLKVGQILYEKAFETAHHLQKSYLWLAVWEENHRAVAFYQKNGFVAFDQHIFKLGSSEQTDIMMKKALN